MPRGSSPASAQGIAEQRIESGHKMRNLVLPCERYVGSEANYLPSMHRQELVPIADASRLGRGSHCLARMPFDMAQIDQGLVKGFMSWALTRARIAKHHKLLGI